MANFISLYKLLILTTLISPFLQTNGSLVDDVCGQTKDAKLCAVLFSFDPKLKNDTLPDLAKYGVKRAGLDSFSIKTRFGGLLNTTTDPNLKNLYGQCVRLYGDTYATLVAASADVIRQRWVDLGAKAVKVSGDVDQCEKAFKGSSPVQKYSYAVEIVAEAIGVIARTLSRIFS